MQVRSREERALVEALRDQVTYCKQHLDTRSEVLKALCNDIGPFCSLLGLTSACRAFGSPLAMLERKHRMGGPTSLTTALRSIDATWLGSSRGCPSWKFRSNLLRLLRVARNLLRSMRRPRPALGTEGNAAVTKMAT
jgi:hypothetical protein